MAFFSAYLSCPNLCRVARSRRCTCSATHSRTSATTTTWRRRSGRTSPQRRRLPGAAGHRQVQQRPKLGRLHRLESLLRRIINESNDLFASFDANNVNLLFILFASTIAAGSVSVATPPAYRSIGNTTGNSSIFLNGVNFASGGAGVLKLTSKVSLDWREVSCGQNLICYFENVDKLI